MAKRGRRSAASLVVVPLGLKRRPEPPAWLPDEQQALWRAVTATKEPDFFDAAVLPLLEQYVTCCGIARGLARDMAANQPSDLKSKAALMALYDTATRAALAHGRSLRITTQSRVTKGAAATQHTGAPSSRPWEASQ